jgi:hypothetical protein
MSYIESLREQKFLNFDIISALTHRQWLLKHTTTSSATFAAPPFSYSQPAVSPGAVCSASVSILNRENPILRVVMLNVMLSVNARSSAMMVPALAQARYRYVSRV